MIALSVWQPHASLIATGKKNVEYRSWPTHHRGDLLITAAARVPRLRRHRHLPRGCALCLVKLIDCVEVEPGLFAWLLADPRPVPSLPVRGQQRLWHVEVETRTERERLKE
jgi:hypothetical protein